MHPSKKKILFISSNMDIGGFQKSLISLLRCLDYQKYDVDLLLLSHHGVFLDLIPEQIRLLSPIVSPEYFMSAPEAIIQLLKQRKWKLMILRLLAALISLVDRGYGAILLSRGIPSLEGHYDVAIDYNGQHILYYLSDRVHAVRKISYFHSDYKKWPYYQNADRLYYRKVDAIVTVSELCVQSMQEVFPEYRDKIHCIENIISEKTVSLFPNGSDCFTDGFEGIRIVSVGRACRDKGVYLALESCSLLKERGFPFHWYWIGPFAPSEEIQIRTAHTQVQGHFSFLGATSNPYDYMRQAQIIVHPSYYEGKSVAVEEAKVLGVPVVATNFSTVYNQIEDGVTGLITSMDSSDIAEAIVRLLHDEGLYNSIAMHLQKYRVGNEHEVQKLYSLIDIQSPK